MMKPLMNHVKRGRGSQDADDVQFQPSFGGHELQRVLIGLEQPFEQISDTTPVARAENQGKHRETSRMSILK
jgi:hypothetical protein